MAFDPELLELMPHTIQVALPTGVRDFHGKPQYGTPKSYRALIEGKLLAIRQEREYVSGTIFSIYVDAGDDVITPECELTLPDVTAFGNRKPMIFTVSKLMDEDGFHHTVINCGFEYHRQGVS